MLLALKLTSSLAEVSFNFLFKLNGTLKIPPFRVISTDFYTAIQIELKIEWLICPIRQYVSKQLHSETTSQMASTCYFENAMNRTWFLPSETERVCPGGCDPAYAIDNDGCWRCHCGSWEPVSAPPTLLFPDLAAYDGQRLWGDVWQDEEAAEFARLDAHAQRMRLLLEASKAREANEKLARAAALSEFIKAQSIV